MDAHFFLTEYYLEIKKKVEKQCTLSLHHTLYY